MNQEEDDFEDFGGFEAAEPVQVNAQNEAAGGVQAGPNPWAAAMFSPAVAGTHNVQPDLLCGQNRFPQHLDTPPTADVALAAEASAASNERAGADRQTNGAGFDPDLEFNDDDGDQFDLDQVSLANDILDGSFRSSGGPSGTGQGLRNPEQLPNISGFDLALDVSHSAGNRTPQQENNAAAGVGLVVNNLGASSGAVLVLEPLASGSRESSERSVSESSEGRHTLSVSPQRVVEHQRRLSEGRENGEEGAIGGQGSGSASREPSVSTEETNKLRQDLEKQITDNQKLTEDLARAHELAEEAKKNYEEVKKDHEKQLEDLRQAGHQTLTVVVNEYKALLSATIAQQQETFEQQFVARLKEEAENFQQLLRQQKEEFDALQVEERRKNEEKLAQAVEEMRKLQQEKFDRQLAEELEKFEKAGTKELEKQKEVLKCDVDKMVGEERVKSEKILGEHQDQFQLKFEKEVERNKEQVTEEMKKQKVKFQEELSVMLDQERVRGQETMATAVQSTRDGMNEYLEEQRQRDRVQQRRQLASLDLFLESARQQLQLLMSDKEPDTDNKEEKPS